MWNDFSYDDLFKIPPTKKPCFLAGTLIKTQHGLQTIETVNVGTKVYSYNFNSNQIELQNVTQTFSNYAEKYIKIFTEKIILETYWVKLPNGKYYMSTIIVK